MLASNSCLAVHLSPNELEARDGPRVMDRFKSSLYSRSADPRAGRTHFETRDANQLPFQRRDSFRRTLLVHQHGVQRLDVSVGHVLAVFARAAHMTQERTAHASWGE